MHTCDALCEVAHGGAVRVYDGQHGGRVVDDDRGVVGECDVHLAIGKDNQAHQTRRKRHGCPSGAWFGGKGFNSGLFSQLLALRNIQKGGLLPPPLFPGWRLSCAGDASASRCISLTAGVRLTDGPRAFSFYVDSHSTA